MDDSQEHTQRISHRTRLFYFDEELHEGAAEHEIEADHEHAILDDANWRSLYAVTDEIELIRAYRRGRLPGSLPDTMGSTELAAKQRIGHIAERCWPKS